MDITKIDLYKDAKGEWRWRIRAANGEIIAASTEGYKEKDSAEKNLYLIADLLIEGFQFVEGDG